ncbi:MAG: hypothetical protein KGJ13_11015 [Patescibacteria group bacterium]|nr:hypothetical protein [Patescibacteria group bacterium]
MQGLTIIASRTNLRSSVPTVTVRKSGLRFNHAALELIGSVRRLSLARDDSGNHYLVEDNISGYTLSDNVSTGTINRFIGTMNAKAIFEAVQKLGKNAWTLEKIDEQTFKLH